MYRGLDGELYPDRRTEPRDGEEMRVTTPGGFSFDLKGRDVVIYLIFISLVVINYLGFRAIDQSHAQQAAEMRVQTTIFAIPQDKRLGYLESLGRTVPRRNE